MSSTRGGPRQGREAGPQPRPRPGPGPWLCAPTSPRRPLPPAWHRVGTGRGAAGSLARRGEGPLQPPPPDASPSLLSSCLVHPGSRLSPCRPAPSDEGRALFSRNCGIRAVFSVEEGLFPLVEVKANPRPGTPPPPAHGHTGPAPTSSAGLAPHPSLPSSSCEELGPCSAPQARAEPAGGGRPHVASALLGKQPPGTGTQ